MDIITSQSSISRRTMLRGLGVGLALPLLDAMATACAAAEPQQLIAILTNQGIWPKYLFPTEAGQRYKPSPYLEILKPFRSICNKHWDNAWPRTGVIDFNLTHDSFSRVSV